MVHLKCSWPLIQPFQCSPCPNRGGKQCPSPQPAAAAWVNSERAHCVQWMRCEIGSVISAHSTASQAFLKGSADHNFHLFYSRSRREHTGPCPALPHCTPRLNEWRRRHKSAEKRRRRGERSDHFTFCCFRWALIRKLAVPPRSGKPTLLTLAPKANRLQSAERLPNWHSLPPLLAQTPQQMSEGSVLLSLSPAHTTLYQSLHARVPRCGFWVGQGNILRRGFLWSIPQSEQSIGAVKERAAWWGHAEVCHHSAVITVICHRGKKKKHKKNQRPFLSCYSESFVDVHVLIIFFHMNQYKRENDREIIMCAEQIFHLTEVVPLVINEALPHTCQVQPAL